MVPRVEVKAGVGVVLALCVGAGHASAADPVSLHDFLFGGHSSTSDAQPTIAKYKADGGEGFVFDRTSGRGALIKYDDSSEIWALTATPGPRGDVIYKNDMGQPVLRATRLGGLTLFTADYPGGTAAAAAGLAAAPRPPPILGPEALLRVLLQAGARATRAAQHLVYFDAGDANVSPSTESVFADCFGLAADAIVQVSGQGRAGQMVVGRLVKVRFIQGPAPNAMVIGSTVQIVVAPQMGLAGRPSSKRIAAAIFRR
ncbi:DUF4908 domain-containing protein [Caulobacter sp. S45]|uniref:DUF4908 domain-containing protein n=1 Tax=Caulobacter sp. S45 TaxID=1641861 RepID=UPI00131C8117|nr:DUF4908 domain-containing protein [Caulobacter sp. S45]